MVEPARDDTADVLDCAAQVLSVCGIRETDNFFALGGNSLAAVELMVMLEDRWERQLDLEAVFDATDFGHLARLVVEVRPAADR